MSNHDPMIHPALLDPRQWADVNLYETTVSLDREPIEGDEHPTPNRHFAIKHLKLDLRFEDDRQKVGGAATLTLAPFNDGFNQFELDIAEMEITSVKLLTVEKRGTGDLIRSAAHLGAPLEYETHAEKLEIQLDRAYARDEQLTVEIVYSCFPRKGLFFVKPDQSYPNKPLQIWSQGENEDAHWWFPCQDVTNQKMTTELIATVKADYFALSNGELVASRDNPDGSCSYHWKQEQPHPAYLVTVVIGEYEHLKDHYDGLPVDYYVYRNRVEEGRKLFSRTPEMIKFFEEKFGYAYPYVKYAQVLVDDFLFGAMENTSATTMTDRCLLDARAELDLNYEDIVAHELAHQWWGDLVTCKDWSQIWLNESFATYSEYLWREHTQGRDEARFALFQDFLTYLKEDRTSHRRPIVSNKYRFSEEIMDRHAYEKGACVLDMLRGVLGDDAFFRSLAHYLNKFEFGVAETNDFKVAIEEVTGINLHWFFDQWLYGEGYPELEVGYDWQREQKTLRLMIKQVQQTDEAGRIFRFPVEIEIVTVEAGEIIETERRSSYQVVVEKPEQDFYFPCEARPRMVLFDKGNRIFKLLHFPKSTQELSLQLARAEDASDRLRAALELSAYKGEEIIKSLRQALLGDDFYGVRMAAAISLGEIGTESSRRALIETYPKMVDSRVRRSCVWAIGKFKDPESQTETTGMLREALEKDQSYFVAVAAARALANLGGDQSFDILAASLSRTSWQEVIASAIFHGWAQAKEKRALDPAIKHSRYGEPAPLRVAAITCLGALGREMKKDPNAAQKLERTIDHLIELLKDKYLRARVSAVRALGKIGDKRALPPLREAQGRECLDMLKAAIHDAIKSLEQL